NAGLHLKRLDRALYIARHHVRVLLGLGDGRVPERVAYLRQRRTRAEHPHREIVPQVVEVQVGDSGLLAQARKLPLRDAVAPALRLVAGEELPANTAHGPLPYHLERCRIQVDGAALVALADGGR